MQSSDFIVTECEYTHMSATGLSAKLQSILGGQEHNHTHFCKLGSDLPESFSQPVGQPSSSDFCCLFQCTTVTLQDRDSQFRPQHLHHRSDTWPGRGRRYIPEGYFLLDGLYMEFTNIYCKWKVSKGLWSLFYVIIFISFLVICSMVCLLLLRNKYFF